MKRQNIVLKLYEFQCLLMSVFSGFPAARSCAKFLADAKLPSIRKEATNI